MDLTLSAIVDCATSGRALPARVRTAVLDHVVDAVGCAVAALGDPTARSVLRAADAVVSDGGDGASAFGVPRRVPADQAAFTNAALVRWLDANDTFNSRTGGHPSDMIAGVLAAAEAGGATGPDLLRGIWVSYEVFAGLADDVPLRDLGWDQSVFIATACAAGISAALGSSRDVAAHGIALAVTATHGLRVTRAGGLSQWKALATPHAVRNAVVLTRLAALGVTGPERPFDGRAGFFEQVGGPIDVAPLAEGVRGIERTAFKFLPIEFAAQAPIQALLAARDRIDLDDVEAIEVVAHRFLVQEIGGGRGDADEKWDPRTRETADHSLPYLIAVALHDGRVGLDSFTPERVRDPRLRPLMRRIAIRERPDAGSLAPSRTPVSMLIRMRSGPPLRLDCEYPFGHPERPASSSDVDAKFDDLATPVVGAASAWALRDAVRTLADSPDCRALGRAFRDVGKPESFPESAHRDPG